MQNPPDDFGTVSEEETAMIESLAAFPVDPAEVLPDDLDEKEVMPCE